MANPTASKTWNSREVRELFLSFFEKNDHLRIPAAGLVPKNDPTLLYINSGMAPLKDYFTGAAKPPQKTLVNVQTCIRTRDIDDVGDRHHLTLFEMMGQWSIGDYFKEKACQLSVDLLVNGYGFDQDKLFVTCYGLKSSLNCASSPEGGPLSIGRPLAGPTYLSYGAQHLPFDWNASHGGVVSYALDLQVAAIPEAATGGMLLAGLSVLALARRRRLGV